MSEFVPLVSPVFPRRTRGTVLLVSLCFVAVMGIVLGSYLAVCNRAMNLSNRSFQASLSKQLAEAGIEEALRAFNTNNWSDWSSSGTTTDWTLDTTNKRATATITYPATKFGQGVTATVKIRVDNYDANVVGVSWIDSKTYRINDLVGYNGVWYRSLQNGNTGRTPTGTGGYPNLTYWAPEPIPWGWSSNRSYTQNVDVVNYDGKWYRCNNTHTSASNFNGGNWTEIPAPVLALYTATNYLYGTFGYRISTGEWLRSEDPAAVTPPGRNFDASKWSNAAPHISWAYRPGVTYYFNDLVFYSGTPGNPGTWYRCKVSSTTSAPTVTTAWENATTGPMLGWNASLNYNIGDVVYHSGTSAWYRCIRSNSGQTPSGSSAYWTNTPLYSPDWDSGKQYSQNDTVRYKGVWYLSIHAGTSNIARNPATATTYWIGADTSDSSRIWNAITPYAAGTYRCYGGAWYRCVVTNTGQSPNNPTYWTATWTQSSGVITGAPIVYAEAVINLGDGTTSRTQLRAPITHAPLFPNAAAATGTISANSGGTVDSYDSTLGTPSSSQYDDQEDDTSTNYSATIASSYSSGTAITLANVNVRGYLAAPPSSSSPHAPLLSSGGTVKGPTASIPNIDLSRLSRSPYIPQFDTLPRNPSGGGGGLAATWSTVPKGTALDLSTTTSIGTPGAITPSRYHHNGHLVLSHTAAIRTLNINGPVILYINGDLRIEGNNSASDGVVNINSAGSAEIHVAGRFRAESNGQGIKNNTSDPKSLIIICDTTSTGTHYYSEGVNPLYGVLYIPYSTSNTGYYNNNNNTHIYGAVSANQITYSGANMNIHYDTSLRYATFGGVEQPYTVSSWRELPAAEQATMP